MIDPLTFLAQSTNGNTWLFAAHDEVWVMLGHDAVFWFVW